MEGTIKFFDAAKYFGFVELTDESGEAFQEYFFHGSRIVGEKEPAKGDTVEFWLEDSTRAEDRLRGGWAAVDVIVKAKGGGRDGDGGKRRSYFNEPARLPICGTPAKRGSDFPCGKPLTFTSSH